MVSGFTHFARHDDVWIPVTHQSRLAESSVYRARLLVGEYRSAKGRKRYSMELSTVMMCLASDRLISWMGVAMVNDLPQPVGSLTITSP
ncbi:MAG: hypothetical protein M2R45_02342 [Verrucomicrobia subdivision 3 bacterium]|nr:hypothetical protein [Limisphaerales bacterium]MCS1414894.1 hypothetical protein [Limisphaerales bacterium]